MCRVIHPMFFQCWADAGGWGQNVGQEVVWGGVQVWISVGHVDLLTCIRFHRVMCHVSTKNDTMTKTIQLGNRCKSIDVHIQGCLKMPGFQ